MHISSHGIRRLRWLVRSSSAAEAFAWRKLLHDRLLDLLPAFEHAFDEATHGNHVIRIPRLELHLKIGAGQDPVAVLPGLIFDQLKDRLANIGNRQSQQNGQYISWQATSAQQSHYSILIHYLRTGLIPWPAAHAPESGAALDLAETCRKEWPQLMDYLHNETVSTAFYFRLLQLIPEEEYGTFIDGLAKRFPQHTRTTLAKFTAMLLASEEMPSDRYSRLRLAVEFLSQNQGNPQSDLWQSPFDILFHYLRTGLITGAALSSSTAGEAPELEKTCRKEWPQLMTYLGSGTESTAFYFRLLQLITKLEYDVLIDMLSGRIPQQMKTAVMEFTAFLFDPDKLFVDRYTRLNLAAEFLSGNPAWQEDAFLPRFYLRLTEVAPHFLASAPIVRTAITRRRNTENDEPACLIEVRPEKSALSPREVAASDIAEEKKTGLAKAPPSSSSPAMAQPIINKTSEQDLFPMMVHQGGLVLLHPFITRLFENTGIIEPGNTSLSPYALARAAALLHFLATGRAEVYEYELDMIKILLGLHPEMPLSICGGLVNPKDREEIEALLQSVLGHWHVLKNTSVVGLRSTFLQRRGLLCEEDVGWKLHVEGNAFDVLLGQLPWGISIVRLPWMTRPIFTEWTTP